MSSTIEGRRLTEAHRLTQARMGAQTIRLMRALWPLLDPDDLDGSFDRWVSAALPVINRQHTNSALVSANYLRAFRTVELGTFTRFVPVVAAFSSEQAATSLLVTGPVHVKQAMARGVPVGRAMATAETTSASSGLRLALNGGRGTILDTVTMDRQALGWARATSGRPCSFCAMLASRGPVYRGQRTADFEAHDACSCTAEPVYRENAAWPSGSQRFADLWTQAKNEDGDPVANFRRLVEAG